jgi:hypothetical protein
MFSSRKFDNSGIYQTTFLCFNGFFNEFSLFSYRLNYRMTSVVYWQFFDEYIKFDRAGVVL